MSTSSRCTGKSSNAQSAARHSNHGHTGPSVALEMQVRALREALYRAAHETEGAKRHSHSADEALRRERLRCAEVEFRLNQLQQAVNESASHLARLDAENLQAENRRLRSLLAESAADRSNLVDETRARAPVVPLDPRAREELAEITTGS